MNDKIVLGEGRLLSLFQSWQLEYLTEKGKDKLIGMLYEKIVSIQNEPALVREVIGALRDELYQKLPTGNVDVFELLNVVKEHLKQLDEVASNEKSNHP